MTIFEDAWDWTKGAAEDVFGVAKGESKYVARPQQAAHDPRLNESREQENQILAQLADQASGRAAPSFDTFWKQNLARGGDALRDNARQARADNSSFSKSVTSDPAMQARLAEQGQASLAVDAKVAGDSYRKLSELDAAQLSSAEQQSAIEQYMRGVAGIRGGDIDIYRTYLDQLSAANQQNAATAAANQGNKDLLVAAGLQTGGALANNALKDDEDD